MEETLEKVNKKLADLPEDKEVVGEVVVSVEIVVKSEIIVKPEVTEVCEAIDHRFPKQACHPLP